MKPGEYAGGLPLSERLYQDEPEIAQRIYSEPVLRFPRDGLVILPGVIDLDTLDRFERDVNLLAENKTNPLLSWVEIDGPI
jgi:hypothetical protein